MALYAGQSCGQLHQILTAEQRLNRIIEEAAETLTRLTGNP